MTGAGLVGVPDPSQLFGAAREEEVGSAVACALEGTRPLLLEIQALVSPTDLAMPRRVATGVDPKRLAMIVAVLSRHAGVALGQADVFVNVAGGVRIDEIGDYISAGATARLKATTPMQMFRIIVTAEDTPTPKFPSPQIVFSSNMVDAS
jgi:predicted ATP-dependent serine protease